MFFKRGFRPLHLACFHGHDNIVSLLFIGKADIEAQGEVNFSYLDQFYPNCIRILLLFFNTFTHPIFLSKERETPLHSASCNGQDKVVNVLLAARANIEATNEVSHK